MFEKTASSDDTTPLARLQTPAALLDLQVLKRNLARMSAHLACLGVPLRPHVKTCKSIDVVRLALDGQPGGITVSTLREAEYFAAYGIRDILYGVGISSGKLTRAADLVRRGVALTLVVDNQASAAAIGAAASREGVTFAVLIELDVDGHRGGVGPQSDTLLELARTLTASPGIEFRGVMTHAGGSYDCRSSRALREMAERERAGAVGAAGRLSAVGINSPVVSVGSTPTALFAQDLTGVTEVRAGVYMFFDLVMHGIGTCALDDIALSVLVSVIGHQPEKNWVIVDGGWMAMSRDRGTERQALDQGYGLARNVDGGILPDDLIMVAANQEHGILARRDGGIVNPRNYPVDMKLRILPNHACATAAQHASYHVMADGSEVGQTWQRHGGW